MSFPGTFDQLTERYKYVKALGHGAFGEVLLAEDVLTGQQVAVKQLYLPEPGAPLPGAVAREVSALQQLQHPNIIGLLDVAIDGCCVYLCQQLCSTDLAAVLAGADHQLPPQLVCSIMQQLLAALAACHAAGIMHRDVKPSNILFTGSGVIKLADFGLAKQFRQHQHHHQQGVCCPTDRQDSKAAPPEVCRISQESRDCQHQRQEQHRQQQRGLQQQQQQPDLQQQRQPDGQGSPHGCHTPAQGTRWYRAPELLYGSCSYGPEVDLWAAGCVLAEMLGLAPFIPGQSDIDQLARMQHVLGSITPQGWPEVEQLPDWHKVSFTYSEGQELAALLPDAPTDALDLLQLLLSYNPVERVSAAAALKHKYFGSAAL